MLGITEKYNKFKESTYFAGGKFVIYSFGIYLAATFTIGCLGAVIGFPLLTFPLAMLISNPVVWVLMGIVLTVAYKMVKDYINKKKAPEGKKSEEKEVEPQKSPEEQEQTVNNQGNPKTPDRDSGVVPDGTESPEDRSRRNSDASVDSGLGSKKFHENLDTLVHQTNRGNYTYWLQQHDIAHIARAVYNYSESSDGDIFFCIPGNLESLSERLREYKNEPEREDTKSIFTSVINLGGNHWVTLVVAYNSNNKQFRAYYCDSFSANLPSPGSKRSSIKLANEIKDKLIVSLTNQASELSAQDKKEMGKDVQKTAQTCRDKKNELVNVPINTDNMVSALEEVLKIENCNIRSSGAKQQSDGHNCGIFALENAHKITQMFNEGKSFYEIDKELSEYKFDLNEKRREFAEALMNDQEWKKDLESGFLCELPPRTKASSTSEVQHTGSFCNIT
ncbi:MAG: hypothetical protein ABS808_05300 [Wolbachia endosymbiont of Polyergus mexicanus]|jgi:hypothetical protein|uniref:Ubiquitin-like protease family profile domain-containing protein n=1 Tax=Wolbachia endosymbiont of Polyergus mexicanus TaxID=3171167 RepID=A0AAU7YHB9_9RICK